MLDCSKCVWKHPDTCRICRAEQREKQLAEDAVHQLVSTQEKFEDIETDPNWWALHLMAVRN